MVKLSYSTLEEVTYLSSSKRARSFASRASRAGAYISILEQTPVEASFNILRFTVCVAMSLCCSSSPGFV